MSKITNSFIVLLLIISFSAVIYIWQSDMERKALENKINAQEEQINTLKLQLEQKNTPADEINNGEVQGATTQTGLINGTITISKNLDSQAIIICANETHTTLETCTDLIIEKQKKLYDFQFDLPQGTYEIYAVIPPLEDKVYYSEVSTCDEEDNCESKAKRLIEVIQEETQSDIDIYL